MKKRTFWIAFSLTTLLVALTIFLFSLFPLFIPDLMLALIGTGLFAFITVLMYYLARKAGSGDNKYAFIQLIIGNVMLKMILAVAVVVTYLRLTHPESKYFVLPFFVIYILYSILETWVLYRLAINKTL